MRIKRLDGTKPFFVIIWNSTSHLCQGACWRVNLGQFRLKPILNLKKVKTVPTCLRRIFCISNCFRFATRIVAMREIGFTDERTTLTCFQYFCLNDIPYLKKSWINFLSCEYSRLCINENH